MYGNVLVIPAKSNNDRRLPAPTIASVTDPRSACLEQFTVGGPWDFCRRLRQTYETVAGEPVANRVPIARQLVYVILRCVFSDRCHYWSRKQMKDAPYCHPSTQSRQMVRTRAARHQQAANLRGNLEIEWGMKTG